MNIFHDKNKLLDLCKVAWDKSDAYYNKSDELIESGDITIAQHHIIRSIAANFESISESFGALLHIATEEERG